MNAGFRMAAGVTTDNHGVQIRSSRMVVRDARSMQRIILKQGYLKKISNGFTLGSFFRVSFDFTLTLDRAELSSHDV